MAKPTRTMRVGLNFYETMGALKREGRISNIPDATNMLAKAIIPRISFNPQIIPLKKKKKVQEDYDWRPKI